MSRIKNRYDENGNYLLPSERDEAVRDDYIDDHDDFASQVRRALPVADELTFKAALRKAQQDARAADSPNVSITPASADKRGTLGGQDTVYTGDDVTDNNNNKQVALWPGDDRETCPVTVTFMPVQQIDRFLSDSGPVYAALRPYGIVRAGTRGAMPQPIKVDIGRGCQFTINASQVSLQVALHQTTGVQASMQLYGALSFWPCTHQSPVTYTEYLDGITLPSEEVFIPPFAKGLFVMNDETLTKSTFSVQFINSSGNVCGEYTYPALGVGNPALPLGFIPIPNDAVAVRLIDMAGLGALSWRLIFQLCL